MNCFHYTVLYILILNVITNNCLNNKEDQLDSEDDDIFVANDEWQVVKEGQKLPQGLHIRINLQSGLKEAKLNHPKDGSKNEYALKTVPTSTDENHAGPDNSNTIKSPLPLKFKLETDLIHDLIDEYHSSEDNQNALRILHDLEFLVHKQDSAEYFLHRNGLTEIVYKNLNETDFDQTIITLQLLASLVQNNMVAKEQAFTTGVLTYLLRKMTLTDSNAVRKSSIFALSALLGTYPKAQLYFLRNDGFLLLHKLFLVSDVNVQVKIASLISDFLVDYEHLKDQYEHVHVKERIIQSKWCEKLNRLLTFLTADPIRIHDLIEKCLIPMNHLGSSCREGFDTTLLYAVYDQYRVLADHNKDIDFDLHQIMSTISNLAISVYNQLNVVDIHTNYKTEL